MWSRLVFFADADSDTVESISGWQNENWACNDFIHGKYCIIQDDGPKLWFHRKWKLQIILCFLKVPKATTSGQNPGNS